MEKGIFYDVKMMARDGIFLKKAVRIALPVAMQGMLNTIVNLVDTMMIGALGATAIAAVGLANKVFFVFTLLVFGIVSGSGVLAAQYWGNGDIKNIKKVVGLALTLAVAASIAFLVPAVVCPEAVMRIFTASEDAIQVGAGYLTIVALSYPATAVSNTFVAMLRATGRVKAPVVISSCTIFINIFFNYTFIYGNFGAPAMSIILVVYLGKAPVAARFKEMFGYSREFLVQFFSTTSPVIANEFIWGLGTTLYSLAYGRMGNDAVAAITIATTIQDIVTVLFQGLSAATAVIMGNEMGAGKLKRAERYAKNFLILQFIVTILGALFCVAIRWQIIGVYNITPEIAESVSRCIIVFALFMPFKMFNYVMVVGILRSGGDTKMCLLLDCSGVWMIGVPMAFLGGLFFGFPIHIVYAMVMLEEVYKAVFGYWRYRQKKWLRNLAAEL